MDPWYGPLPPAKGSDVWALTFYRVYKEYIRGTLLRYPEFWGSFLKIPKRI